jgi:hypothetical protein
MKITIGDSNIDFKYMLPTWVKKHPIAAILALVVVMSISAGVWKAWYRWYPTLNQEEWMASAAESQICRRCGSSDVHQTGKDPFTYRAACRYGDRALKITIPHVFNRCTEPKCKNKWLSKMTDKQLDTWSRINRLMDDQ